MSEDWVFEDFHREIEKNKVKLPISDESVRQARFFQAKYAYETMNQEERESNFFKYRNEVDFSNEEFTFFWVTKSPLSQWYKCSFDASYVNVYAPVVKEDNNIHRFSSAEQYMMYAKAMLFVDREVAAKILTTNDVRKIKELGRQVKHFELDVWEYNRIHIVYSGNKAKFSQNDELYHFLLSTQGTTLVEAAPDDNIWGIGLAEDDERAKKRETWGGQNLLGEILTQLRFDLTGAYRTEQIH